MNDMEIVGRSKDPEVLIDELMALAEARQAEALRVRVQPSVLHPVHTQYVALPQTSFLLDVKSAQGVKDLRTVLALTFELTATLGGPTAMVEYLRACQTMIADERGAHPEGAEA